MYGRKNLFVIWVILSLGIAGSAWSGGTNIKDGDTALTPVSLQLKWLHQFQFAGYYIALENGYYQEQGIDVDIVERQTGVSAIEKLISGEVQFAITDVGALIYRSSGVPVVSLAAIFQNSPSVLIARGDKGIGKLSDLIGKSVRNSGGFNNAELFAMLEADGVSMKDINIILNSQSMDSFIAGDTVAINGYMTNEPFMLKNAGIPFKLFRPVDYGIDFYGDLLITTQALITEDPDLVRRFRLASLQGWEYAVSHPSETIDLILEKYNSQKKTRKLLEFEASETIKLILSNVVPIGFMHVDRWNHIAETLSDQGWLLGPVDFDEFIYDDNKNTDSFVYFLKLYYKEVMAVFITLIFVMLAVHIIRLRSQVRDSVAELKLAHDRAKADARTDALTGLPNRRHFIEVFNRDLDYARRKKQPLSLVMTDVDDFKTINDKYGHGIGDDVLKDIGAFFKYEGRGSDFVARIGGEEFVIICRDTSLGDARMVTERLRHMFSSNQFNAEDRKLHITMSFGLVCFTGEETAEQLLSKADSAMYEAKHGGKNKVAVR